MKPIAWNQEKKRVDERLGTLDLIDPKALANAEFHVSELPELIVSTEERS